MGALCGGRKARGRVAARGESTPASVNYSPWMLSRVFPLPPAVNLSFVLFPHKMCLVSHRKHVDSLAVLLYECRTQLLHFKDFKLQSK